MGTSIKPQKLFVVHYKIKILQLYSVVYLYFSALDTAKMFAATDSLDDKTLLISGTRSATSAVELTEEFLL